MATQEYLDFELSIEALPNDQLRVTLVNSPVGSASVDVPNPITSAEAERIISILDGRTRVPRGEAARAARAFGEKLFSAVFSGQIYAAYLTSRSQAGERGLRIRLNLDKAEGLYDLPWELLRDPSGDYLALSRQTPIIRYPRLLNVRPVVEVSLPLRVLVLISSPKDQAELNVEAEWQTLQEATADLRQRGLLELERVDDAQLITLQRKLRSGVSYQIFHYIGHATFDERSGAGLLAFEAPRTELTQPVSGEALARELVEENTIRLVVLNACQGARQARNDPFSGIASSIVARGVPAVVAMQFPITDDAARIFAHEFYRALSEGYPIEAAMAEARRAIGSSLNNLEWATPVLFLRAQSGMLFPKRRTFTERPSYGGVREALLRPRALIGLAAMLLVVFGLVSLLSSLLSGATTPTQPAQTPTLNIATFTPTPNAPRNIDLVITRVRFLPPNPAPGQPVTVAIELQNNGTSDSGPFDWVWFDRNAEAADATPALRGTVANLSPRAKTTVIGTYRFGWWGTYLTTAWVNPDNRAPESNIFNNFVPRTLNTSAEPFVVDFARLPDESLLEAGVLRGDEFAKWSLGLRVDAEGNTECAAASLLIALVDDLNQVTTGLPNAPSRCANLPVILDLVQPPDAPRLSSVRVEFLPTAAGEYALEVRAADNSVQRRETVRVEASEVGVPKTLDVAVNGAARLALRVPESGRTIIRRLTRTVAQP
ncbi:MAG: CHAT domain-containing protein [Anaerolineae bacterium]|nr:CHAT domain-containing protein [Anaerolineae bacterium]MDW8298188.1 CHAT domain-containing protein [Anaerolineae bacterium]